jgi:hypothetical protein
MRRNRRDPSSEPTAAFGIATVRMSNAEVVGESEKRTVFAERAAQMELIVASRLLARLKSGSMLIAGRGYDADWIRALVAKRHAWANILPRSNRKRPTTSPSFSSHQYGCGCALVSQRPRVPGTKTHHKKSPLERA